MNYATLATDERIAKTAVALKEHNIESIIVSDKAEALAKIKELIPKGASVMNGASVTLEEIGFVDHLKAAEHEWNNLHEAIVLEKDPEKQSQLRKQALLSDYYLGSVHALTETGEMLIASNTGSQMPHIVFSSPNLIFVVGAQKITADLEAGRKRLVEYVVPLEEKHMQEKYGVGTRLNKEIVFHGENLRLGRKIQVIIIKEKLGF